MNPTCAEHEELLRISQERVKRLEDGARALVSAWRKEWESDERDYYAGQYSRADQHADQLEDLLDHPLALRPEGT